MNTKWNTFYKVLIWKGILSTKYEYERVYFLQSMNMKGYTLAVYKVWIQNGILSIKYEYERVYCL